MVDPTRHDEQIEDSRPFVVTDLDAVESAGREAWASVCYISNKPTRRWQKDRSGPVEEARTTPEGGIVVRFVDDYRDTEQVLVIGETFGDSSVKTVRSDGHEATIGTPVRCRFFEGRDRPTSDASYFIQTAMRRPDNLLGAALLVMGWNKRTRKGVGIPDPVWDRAVEMAKPDD